MALCLGIRCLFSLFLHRTRPISPLRSLNFHPVFGVMYIHIPWRCPWFPGSWAASQRFGRSDQSHYPNEEENKKIRNELGDLIGHTRKTITALWNAKTWGRRERETWESGFPGSLLGVCWTIYFPQTWGVAVEGVGLRLGVSPCYSCYFPLPQLFLTLLLY